MSWWKVLFIVIVVFGVALLSFLFQGELTVEEEIVEQKDRVVEEFKVNLSSNLLNQGDTLLITANEEDATVHIDGEVALSANWNNTTISFTGIDVKEKVGSRNVVITSKSGEQITDNFTITSREFPTTYFSVPDKVTEQGKSEKDVAREITKVDKPTLDSVLKITTPTLLFSEPFIEPLPEWIDVGGFGVIRQSEKSGIRHLGVDLDAKKGDKVKAANSGIVRLADYLPSFGNTIAIDHGQGIFTLYLHLQEMTTHVGDTIEQGEVIGTVGNTGAYSFDPHLHFSVKVRQKSVDPGRFLELEY